MRVICTGDRNWRDPHSVYSVLAGLQREMGEYTVVHGAGRGLDHEVDVIARRLGLEVEPHPADWGKLGRKAGPIRNWEMVRAGATLVCAFKRLLSVDLRTGGTEHCMRIALDAHVPVAHFPIGHTWAKEKGRYVHCADRSLVELLATPAWP